MRNLLRLLKHYIPYLLYVLFSDLFFVVLLWTTDTSAFRFIASALILFSILSFLLLCAWLHLRERRIRRALEDYLSDPDENHTKILLSRLSGMEKERIATLLSLLEEKEQQRAHLLSQSEDYEEYVEAWAHEAKTPIALLSLILDNNRDNMDPEMTFKIEYIRSRLSGSVDQMLQYARIKGERKDYLFEELSLREVIDEVIEEYRPLLLEKNFTVINKVKEEKIYSDRRGLLYMLGQFISNSIKYSSDDPLLEFYIEPGNHLVVEDNGIGVKKCDLPYIFERGFTGDSGQGRKKATGMGLYLAAKIAEDMNFELNVSSETGKGFRIVVQYPNVEQRRYRN
ncbi:MAG: sensor histidine kinase [Clostridiales bacterium]|nr:sensor histidine kinase [Clostridiales bacterium]